MNTKSRLYKTLNKCCDTVDECCEWVIDKINSKDGLSSADELKLDIVLNDIFFFINNISNENIIASYENNDNSRARSCGKCERDDSAYYEQFN